MLSATLHTTDRALAAPQAPASAHGQNDRPLLSWVVKDGHLATRQPRCKRASGANGLGRVRTRGLRSRLEPMPVRIGA